MVSTNANRWARPSLLASQGVLALAIAWAAYRVVVVPELTVSNRPVESTPTSQPVPLADAHPLAWYAPIWQRDLRQSPVDPAPKATPPKPKRKPKPEPVRVTLLGTIVERDQRYGVFRNEQGHIVVKRLQEEIDQFTIVRIDRGRAELVRGLRIVRITVPGYEALQFEEVR